MYIYQHHHDQHHHYGTSSSNTSKINIITSALHHPTPARSTSSLLYIYQHHHDQHHPNCTSSSNTSKINIITTYTTTTLQLSGPPHTVLFQLVLHLPVPLRYIYCITCWQGLKTFCPKIQETLIDVCLRSSWWALQDDTWCCRDGSTHCQNSALSQVI